MYLSSIHTYISTAQAFTPALPTDFQHGLCIRGGACILFDSPDIGGNRREALLTEYLQGADVSGGNRLGGGRTM
jgi:hypothetical protein